MAVRLTIDLPSASIEIEERAGYLLVVEKGSLRELSELRRYMQEMERVIAKTGLDRAVIDARSEDGSPSEEVRTAMWDWLCSPSRGFTLVAFVLPSEMAVARVNMTALSRRASVRAFDSVQAAQRWLVRGSRTTSTAAFGALLAPSSMPPESSHGPASSHGSSPPDSHSTRPSPHAPTERPPPPSPSSSRPPPTTSLERRGFRAPTPGPSEHIGTPNTLRAPSERVVRKSDAHRRSLSPSDLSSGKKGGGQGGAA